MYFVLFEATPRRDALTDSETAGAFVSCWIERVTLDEAVRVARSSIEAYAVDDATYPPGKVGRDKYVQALIDKEVYFFFEFPQVDGEWPGE